MAAHATVFLMGTPLIVSPQIEGASTSGRGRTGIRAAQTLTSARSRRKENIAGEFFVDHTCIDCDTCRWMVPEVYSSKGGMSAVHKQPETSAERTRALQALLACPTASIHTEEPPKDIRQVQKTFPLPIDEATLPGIYHCGYHSEKSYGATPYLVVRPEGNILVDSPKYIGSLAKRIEELGGIRYIFLTHRDDVADHAKWASHFRAERVIHRNEMNSSTRNCERPLDGEGPWQFGPDIDLIFTPGHTSGCVSLLYKPARVLFTGDHLCYSGRLNDLSIMRGVNWYSVPLQLESVKALLPLDFVWLLPGHGRRYKFENLEDKDTKLKDLIARES